MSAATCEPPPEHWHREWHWLRAPSGKVRPYWWRGGCYMVGLLAGAEWLYREGWRYVGPAIPPQEGE